MKQLIAVCAAVGALLFSSGAFAQNLTIEIKRASYNANSITGELFVNGAFVSHTLELPWRNNESYVSSIPAGDYGALLRYDKNDQWRLQLTGVPGRGGIQIHVGNWPNQIEGCVLVGTTVNNVSDELEPKTSVPAYNSLKTAFYGTPNPVSTPDVDIIVRVSHYPQRTKFTGGGVQLDYQDKGRWSIRFQGQTISLTEERRDLQHIVLRGTVDGDTAYIRVPLFGGKLAESDSPSGPWDSSDAPTVTRSN